MAVGRGGRVLIVSASGAMERKKEGNRPRIQRFTEDLDRPTSKINNRKVNPLRGVTKGGVSLTPMVYCRLRG